VPDKAKNTGSGNLSNGAKIGLCCTSSAAIKRRFPVLERQINAN